MREKHPRWRTMDAAQREIAYSPSKALPDGDLTPFIARYAQDSAQVYAAHPNYKSLRYGPKPANTLDLFRPDANAPCPLHIFIHGGYWQALSKHDSVFPAEGFLAQGIAFAALDYTLAPEATIDEIIAECVDALRMIFEQGGRLGIDTSRISLSGSSAGAHLVAMTCLSLPRNLRPCAAILLSGVYALEPLVGTYINDPLKMSAQEARHASPALKDLGGFPPALVTWGEIEPDEFKRQSQMFAALLPQVEVFETPSRNHFDIVFDLSNDSPLAQRVFQLSKAKL